MDILYPERYALQQAMGEFMSKSQLNLVAQDEGIFISSANQTQLAEFLSGLFYEQDQLERIRNIALQAGNTGTLSGFRVVSEDPTFDLADLLDSFRGDIVDKNEKMVVGPLISHAIDHGNELYKGSVKYSQYKPGRVAFLQGAERHFEYYVQKINESTWEVSIDCSRSYDGRLMDRWIPKILPKQSYVDKIEQDQLSTEQAIRFFDTLGNEGGGTGWRFVQVRRIALRREQSIKSDGDEEKVETDTAILAGISEAILEGNELRENQFVQECEAGGYRFNAMTFEYENVDDPYTKQIRAEFKFRPKMFEVSLDKYSRVVGIDAEQQPELLSTDRRMSMLSIFWGKAKSIYDTILRENVVI